MKLGLVLAGGGGKGSYEIGVWKYLKEIGLDKKISVISGTSVGGLNAALMGTVDYKTAEHIWLNEINDKILDKNSSEHKEAALFSRDGIKNIIDSYVDLSKLSISDKKIYVTSYNLEGLATEAFLLNNYEVSEIIDMLCATSAIPIVFEKEKIFGKTYIDGGVKDNVPIHPLLDESCTHALIVNLGDFHTDYSGYDIKAIVIHPSKDLGGLKNGTLDFSPDNALKRINLGYNDCLELYSLQIESLLGDNMNDEQIKKVNEINEMNDKRILLETLKIISLEPSLVKKIRCNVNLQANTLGGKIFWEELASYNGWKFQGNKFTKHIRLLDQNHSRQLWGNKDKIIDICKNFLVQEIKNAETQ